MNSFSPTLTTPSPKPKPNPNNLLRVPLKGSRLQRKDGSGSRARSSSLIAFQEIEENYDGTLDQSSVPNWNAEWVNYKGAWLIHVLLLVLAQLLISSVPNMTPSQSWTVLNVGYQAITYIIFHYSTGVPAESQNAGAYDRLTLWEQIDGGAQYTPSKKWLTTLPIVVFLLATHYITKDPKGILFSVNFLTLVILGILPKLPTFHRIRLRFEGLNKGEEKVNGDLTPFEHSGPPTPTSVQMQALPFPHPHEDVASTD